MDYIIVLSNPFLKQYILFPFMLKYIAKSEPYSAFTQIV